MTTMRDQYGDLFLLTSDGWKFVDENDREDPPVRKDPIWWGWDERDHPDEDCEDDN